MTYRDLIEKYKNGELEGAQKERIERDIERQMAISDYLYENEQIPSISEILGESPKDKTADDGAKNETIYEKREAQKKAAEKESLRTIKRAVRQKLVKTAVVTGIAVLAIVLAFTFIVPGAMNIFYYDPFADGFYTSLNVCNDLFLMEAGFNNLEITSAGYGKYYIKANELYYDHLTENGISSRPATGTIEKGVLLTNGSKMFSRSTDHMIFPQLAGVTVPDTLNTFPIGGENDDDLEIMKINNTSNLVDNVSYEASITFDKPYELTEFAKLTRDGELGPKHTQYGQVYYPVICCKNGNTDTSFEVSDLIVFNSEYSYRETWDEDNEITTEYPFLNVGSDIFDSFVHHGEYRDAAIFWYSRDNEDIIEHAYATTKHIVSSLRYLADHEDFCRMMAPYSFGSVDSENMNSNIENQTKIYRDLADSLEKNGVYVYGLVIRNAEASQLETLAENEHVKYISASPRYPLSLKDFE